MAAVTYLNDDQLGQLLRGINPKRVNKDRKGNSHVEAYEIRAHLSRIFGFGRWSETVDRMEMIFESVTPDRDAKNADDRTKDRVTVAYRAQVTLTVHTLDGQPLATYAEWAMGDAQNFPIASRGDAHDFAIKTAESQAFKRSAMNLGDQFGLSLYAKGSTNPVVLKTLIRPDVEKAAEGIDDDADPSVPEDTTPPVADPADDPRSVTQTAPPAPTAPARAIEIRDELVRGPHKAADKANPKLWVSGLLREATAANVLSARVTDADGNDVSLKLLIEQRLTQAAA